jgi:hypothetical protein
MAATMRTQFSSKHVIGAALLSVGMAACWGGPRAAVGGEAHAAPRTHAHRCAGPQGSSRVARLQEVDGSETLRGDTDIPLRPGSTGRLHLTETATIDPRGQLVHARVVVARPRAPEIRFVLEPQAAMVRITRDGAATIDWRVPADAPWLYRSLSSADGLLASTPLAAWIAARAVAAGPVVRVLEPERQESYLVTIDQVAVATEKGTTVVLNDDGIDTDGDFVTQVRLSDRLIRLDCADPAFDAGG